MVPVKAPLEDTYIKLTQLPQLELPKILGNYMRTGGCTPGCGACCEKVILPLDPRLRSNPHRFRDWVKWAELHGMTIIDDGERLDVYIPIQCEALTDDKMCSLIDEDGANTPERPDMCGRYPQSPRELETVKNVCTYKFEPLKGV